MTSNKIRRGYFRAYAEDGNLFIDRQSSGFFADCSVRLHNIIAFYNLNKRLPKEVNSEGQFDRYRSTQLGDISGEFFDTDPGDVSWSKRITFAHTYQYNLYNKLPVADLEPILNKYFTPTNYIEKISRDIIDRYDVHKLTNNFENACTILHRGTDKTKETQIPKIVEIQAQANKILKTNPNTVFILQSDCEVFLDEMKEMYKHNHICFDDHIRVVGTGPGSQPWKSVDLQSPDREQNNIFIKHFLAIIGVLKRSKYIICETGNCGMWLLLFRKRLDNIIQYQGRWKREPVGWYDNL